MDAASGSGGELRRLAVTCDRDRSRLSMRARVRAEANVNDNADIARDYPHAYDIRDAELLRNVKFSHYTIYREREGVRGSAHADTLRDK